MIKIGILGCGVMGKNHGRAYQTISDCQVMAVCDIREDEAKKVASFHNANVYTSFDEMLLSEELDIVDICLPTYLHKKYALMAMNKGKHTFCEKPIALSITDANEMKACALANNVKLSVGHVLRFFPEYVQAAEQFTEDKLGTVRLIRTSRNQAFPKWSWENWFTDYDKSGGPILDLIIHDIDWIIYNFGPVSRVYAKSYGSQRKGQDHSILVLRLKNGAIAHVEGSWAYPEGAPFKMSYELVGTKGQLEYDNLKDAALQLQTTNNQKFEQIRFSAGSYDTEPYRAELQGFVQSVLNNTEALVTADEGIEALKVALAAKKSIETGQPIILD